LRDRCSETSSHCLKNNDGAVGQHLKEMKI